MSQRLGIGGIRQIVFGIDSGQKFHFRTYRPPSKHIGCQKSGAAAVRQFPKSAHENNMYVLYRFLQNDSLSSITMENVEESYDFLLSQEKAKETEEDSVYPNVIVIMNESWWNTDNIDPDRKCP